MVWSLHLPITMGMLGSWMDATITMFYKGLEDQTQVIRLLPHVHLSNKSLHSLRHDILETIFCLNSCTHDR